MRTFFIFVFTFFISKSIAQSIQLEYGGMAFLSKIEEEIPYSKKNYDYTSSFLTFLFQKKYKDQMYLSLGYTQYRPGTSINIADDPATDFLSSGVGSVLCRNFIIGFGYEQKIKKRMFISPCLLLHLSKSNKQIIGVFEESFERYSGTLESKVYENLQGLPDFRLNIGINFLKKYSFFVTGGYLFGFKKIQDLTYKYSFNGVPQPVGNNYTTGTNYHVGVGLRYNFK